MNRNVGRGENPFRERNPANAEKRRKLMENGRSRLDAIEQYMNERHERLGRNLRPRGERD